MISGNFDGHVGKLGNTYEGILLENSTVYSFTYANIFRSGN